MNIYVGNLSSNTSEPALQALFETCGQVSSVKIITDYDTGYSKGFGFVEMANDNEAKEAIQKLNTAQFEGNTLTVNEARPRAEKSNNYSSGGNDYSRGNGGGNYRGNSNNRGGGKRW